MKYIVKNIVQMANDWDEYIDPTGLALRCLTKTNRYDNSLKFPRPDPKGTDINMMPFIMNGRFERTKLPQYLYRYWPLINTVFYKDSSQWGKICYLTIHESFVKKGYSQRRPGLHVESPGNIKLSKDQLSDKDPLKEYIFSDIKEFSSSYNICAGWGRGDNQGKGGIYMASSVDHSCIAWNCRIIANDEKDNNMDSIGDLGDVEHLRGNLADDKMMILEKNKLYWITDRTPHCVLPMDHDGNRQFFRIVTHELSLWYEQHCTKNPNGVIPDPKITRIIKTDKFDNNQSCK